MPRIAVAAYIHVIGGSSTDRTARAKCICVEPSYMPWIGYSEAGLSFTITDLIADYKARFWMPPAGMIKHWNGGINSRLRLILEKCDWIK